MSKLHKSMALLNDFDLAEQVCEFTKAIGIPLQKSISRPGGPCCVQNCVDSNPYLSKHRFPNPLKDILLFNKWVALCGNRALTEKTPERVYNNYRVCSCHIAQDDFSPNNKLKKGVLPSKNLSVLLESVENVKTIEQVIKPVLFEHNYALPSTSQQSSTLSSSLLGRSTLPSEVNVSQVKDLTPKANHLYERARDLKRKASASPKRRLSLKRRLEESKTTSKHFMVGKGISSMDSINCNMFNVLDVNIMFRTKKLAEDIFEY